MEGVKRVFEVREKGGGVSVGNGAGRAGACMLVSLLTGCAGGTNDRDGVR